jgi:hypothetical protein
LHSTGLSALYSTGLYSLYSALQHTTAPPSSTDPVRPSLCGAAFAVQPCIQNHAVRIVLIRLPDRIPLRKRLSSASSSTLSTQLTAARSRRRAATQRRVSRWSIVESLVNQQSSLRCAVSTAQQCIHCAASSRKVDNQPRDTETTNQPRDCRPPGRQSTQVDQPRSGPCVSTHTALGRVAQRRAGASRRSMVGCESFSPAKASYFPAIGARQTERSNRRGRRVAPSSATRYSPRLEGSRCNYAAR